MIYFSLSYILSSICHWDFVIADGRIQSLVLISICHCSFNIHKYNVGG